MEKDELVAWSRIKEERREHTITKLLHSVEESALTLANSYKTPTELEIKATEMGEIIIITQRALMDTQIILNCSAIYPHLCAEREVLDNCQFHTFNFMISLFSLKKNPRIKTLHLRGSSQKNQAVCFYGRRSY